MAKRQFQWLASAVLIVLLPIMATGAGPQLFDRLEADGVVYENVRVREVTPEALIIFHKKGIAKVPLATLPEDLQVAYGYDPEAAAAHRAQREAEVQAARQQQNPTPREQEPKPKARQRQTSDQLAQAMAQFGREPRFHSEVDFRPELNEYQLWSDHQGRRPSCAVFAVTSALELVRARAYGKPEPLSEEYLIWATRETVGLNRQQETRTTAEAQESLDADTGFSLLEVIQALASYGIPLQDDVPNTFSVEMAQIPAPGPEVVERARGRQRIRAFAVPGRETDVRLGNIVHVLNAGMPVVVGMAWPPSRALRVPTLSEQTPREGYAHAVTLVGYKNETGLPQDTLFIFKNSWGVKWGVAGYGFVTWDYLARHLQTAVLLDVVR